MVGEQQWPRAAGQEGGLQHHADAGEAYTRGPCGSSTKTHRILPTVPLCDKLFSLSTHVVVPGNYRVKGNKKVIISPHQSLTVLHPHLSGSQDFCLHRCHFDFRHIGKEFETLSK